MSPDKTEDDEIDPRYAAGYSPERLAARQALKTSLLLEASTALLQHAGEDVASNHGYPPGYQVKPVAEQIKILRERFPRLIYFGPPVEIWEIAPLPTHAEGWFAIPRWENIATTYNQAVGRVLRAIRQERCGSFYDYDAGRKCLHQSERTSAALRSTVIRKERSDFLLVPAQFGLRHRGRSARRAREMFVPGEFGLGAFEVGIMLLTHPERLSRGDWLGIICAGDEYAPAIHTDHWYAPFFQVSDGVVEFFTHPFGYASRFCGSVSGFIQP